MINKSGEADRWNGLGDFIAAMDFWVRVQGLLEKRRTPTGEWVRPVLFDPPYMNGDRLELPNGPRRAEDSDGFERYWIMNEGPWICLRSTSRDRAGYFENLPRAWFSTMVEAGKYFVHTCVAFPTRLLTELNLEIINHRWLDRGVAQGWDLVNQSNSQGFGPSVRFYRTDQTERFYITDLDDSATSHLLNFSWRELTETFLEGIPGVEGLTIPRFSDD